MGSDLNLVHSQSANANAQAIKLQEINNSIEAFKEDLNCHWVCQEMLLVNNEINDIEKKINKVKEEISSLAMDISEVGNEIAEEERIAEEEKKAEEERIAEEKRKALENQTTNEK